LQIGGTIGAGLLITGNNTDTVTLTGTRTEINNALSTVTYRANNGFTGTDTLTMITDDQGNTGLGGAKSDTDTVQITVQAPALPDAADDTASAVEDGPAVTIDVLFNDSVNSGEQATLEDFDPTSTGGTITLDDNGTPLDKTDDQLIFTPAANFSGQTSFNYVMNDTGGTGSDSTGTVIVNVAPVNDRPIARGNGYGPSTEFCSSTATAPSATPRAPTSMAKTPSPTVPRIPPAQSPT
jgi:hypothetical protein